MEACPGCQKLLVLQGLLGRFGGGVSRAFGELLKEGQQGTGWVGASQQGSWSPGPVGAGSPGDLWSLHLLCEDVSQPMAGPGAPSRPPPAAPHPPACRGARLTQGPAPGDIASRGLAELRCAPLSAPPPELLRPPGVHRPRPPPPGPRVPRGVVQGDRGAAIPAEGAAWGQQHRARARRRRRSLGARARAGAGRTCVCLCRSPTRGSAQGQSLLECVGGRDLVTETVRKGDLAP